jgi:hypothetical protein
MTYKTVEKKKLHPNIKIVTKVKELKKICKSLRYAGKFYTKDGCEVNF